LRPVRLFGRRQAGLKLPLSGLKPLCSSPAAPMDSSARAMRRRPPAWLRWGIALLAPALVLAAAEGLLRISGFGHPTDYFIPAAEGPPGHLVENPEFGRRFFPAGLLRVPPPTSFNWQKAPGTLRIFVFGESA